MSDLKVKKLKLTGFILCAVIFVALAITMYFFRSNPPFVDAEIRDFFYTIRGKKYGFLFWLFTFITEFGNLWIVIIILAVAFFHTSADFRFFLLLFGVMLTVIIVVGMKDVYSRERPFAELQWAHEDYKSFPSGHSAVSGFLYTFLIYIFYHSKYSIKIKRCFAALCGVTIILVMTSRLVLGVHYFTDVLAGASSGIMVSFLCMLLYRYCLNNNILTKGLFVSKE